MATFGGSKKHRVEDAADDFAGNIGVVGVRLTRRS